MFTDSSTQGLMHSQIVNCSEMFTLWFGLTVITSIWTVSHIQWNDRISHPCNLIGSLNFFQALEDCDQFRIANGMSPLVRYHKGHRSNKKDSCSESIMMFILKWWYSYQNVTNLKTSGELGLVILVDVLCNTRSCESSLVIGIVGRWES